MACFIRHTFKTRQLFTGGIFLGTLLLSGCGRSVTSSSMPLTAAEAAKPPMGKVVVWSWNIAAKALKDLIPSFEKRYPGVHVTVDMTGAKMQTRFMLSLAADVGAPEISQLQLSDAPHYMATGKLADLTAVAAQYSNDFPASRWEDCEVRD